MKKHEQISLRQLLLGYFLYSLSSKILTLPGRLAQGCGHLAWLAAGIDLGVEILLVGLATLLLKILPQRGRIWWGLSVLLVPLLGAEIWFCAKEIYQMAYTDLNTHLSLLIFILTLVLMATFFLTRQPRAFFRTGEIIWWFFALGLLLAIIPPLYHLHPQWTHLVQGNYHQLLPTAGRHLLAFESASFVLIFGAETQKTKSELVQINLTAWLCAIGYLVFMVLLVLLFGPMLAQKSTAIVEITTAANFLTNSGSLDWLIAAAALGALVLRFGWQIIALKTLWQRGRKK